MILSDAALTKISQNFLLSSQPRNKRSISTERSANSVASHLRCTEEREQIEILQKISLCLFELYENKLDKTIKRVRDGKLNESEILPQLTKFKFILKKNCGALTEDIWDNYKFYAAQRDKLATEAKGLPTVSLMTESFNSTLPTAITGLPPQPEPKPTLQTMTVSPEIIKQSGPCSMINILSFQPTKSPCIQTTKNSMNNSLNTIGVKSWMKPSSSGLTPKRTRNQSSASRSAKRQKSERRSEKRNSEYQDGSKTERPNWQNNLRSSDSFSKNPKSKTSSRNMVAKPTVTEHKTATKVNVKTIDTYSNRSFSSRGEIVPVLKRSTLSNPRSDQSS